MRDWRALTVQEELDTREPAGRAGELGQQALRERSSTSCSRTRAAVAARELGVDQRRGARAHPRRPAGCSRAPASGCRTGVLGGVLPVDPARLARDLGSASSISRAIGRAAAVRRDRGAQPGSPRLQRRRLRASSRRVAGVLGAAGERAGHEDLVRDSEAQFRELADTTPALMWMTDAEGDVTFVNQGWLRFTGGHVRRRRDVRGERPSGRPRGGVRLWDEASSAARGVPLRVPPAPRGLGRVSLGARGRHAALLRRRVRGLRGHGHGHPRAARDGGGAARVRGELPRAGRHGPGDDVDDRRRRPRSRS